MFFPLKKCVDNKLFLKVATSIDLSLICIGLKNAAETFFLFSEGIMNSRK